MEDRVREPQRGTKSTKPECSCAFCAFLWQSFIPSICSASYGFVSKASTKFATKRPALQIRVGEFQGPFTTQLSCGLKSALRSLAQPPRLTRYRSGRGAR